MWRYPIAIALQFQPSKKSKSDKIDRIPKQDLEYALQSMQSFTDITEIELESIYKRTGKHQLTNHLLPENIRLGGYYLHGKNDGNGVIRRVIDESMDNKDMIIYKNCINMSFY